MGKTITKEEISKFELEEFSGKIIVVESEEEADNAVVYLSTFPRLGFDTETRPTFKKGKSNEVALIQLATEEVCFLFRLNTIGFPNSLNQLLSNPDILKIGLSIKDDFSTIRRRISFTPQGFVELQTMAPQHGIDDISLQKMYALLFNKKISKNQRLTNWEAEVLTESQIKYAALDAWACLKIYDALCHTKKYS
ncbi:3'-5' exonuclease domain-containing protein 2 [Bacteroidales bacterium OttesenSCG-928-M11]|nr:3'-5' exonuclease domain-containing protein 2 [Bacteroidales bacterium OttesenSCG-928-M11]